MTSVVKGAYNGEQCQKGPRIISQFLQKNPLGRTNLYQHEQVIQKVVGRKDDRPTKDACARKNNGRAPLPSTMKSREAQTID